MTQGNPQSLRIQLLQLAESDYAAELCYSWPDKYPNYVTLKHPLNHKWFGIIMDIPSSYLGLPSEEVLDVLNVKADPLLIKSLVHEEGYHPAWHMNKQHWISVRLDGSVPLDKIVALLDMSFAAVAPKQRVRKSAAEPKQRARKSITAPQQQ